MNKIRRSKSLKSGLLFRIIIPFIGFIILESVSSYFVTLYYVDKTYDRWLLDSANSVAQEIKVRHAGVLVELPLPALEIVRWDDLDKTYFKITSRNKGFLAGDAFVPDHDVSPEPNKPIYYSSRIEDKSVRIVAIAIKRLDRQDTFHIHVAETLKKRNETTRDILLADLLPQMVLLFSAVIALFIGLNKSLSPLKRLADEIGKRSPRDLSQIAETHVLTEVKTLTDTINRLFEKLSEAIAGQQRFIANAAHQLRTPLAGFVTQAERAAREEDINAMRPALYQMQHSAFRLSHTVNQLLVLAKSELLDSAEIFHRVDLCTLAKSTCIDWVSKATQRKADISYESTVENLTIIGDESLLRKLLGNLLSNAITYGGDHCHITVKLTETPAPSLAV